MLYFLYSGPSKRLQLENNIKRTCIHALHTLNILVSVHIHDVYIHVHVHVHDAHVHYMYSTCPCTRTCTCTQLSQYTLYTCNWIKCVNSCILVFHSEISLYHIFCNLFILFHSLEDNHERRLLDLILRKNSNDLSRILTRPLRKRQLDVARQLQTETSCTSSTSTEKNQVISFLIWKQYVSRAPWRHAGLSWFLACVYIFCGCFTCTASHVPLRDLHVCTCTWKVSKDQTCLI